MWSFTNLIRNFFTHKDFLPAAKLLPGTLFTPLHFVTSACWLGLIVLACLLLRKKEEKTIRKVFTVLWVTVVVMEISKILWETFCGADIHFEIGGVLPLYPCSIFMYAMPFASGVRVRSAMRPAAMFAVWVCWAVLSILCIPPTF